MDPELAQRFDEISRQFAQVNARLDTRFEAIDRRFDSVDRRFERVDQQFEHVYERIEEGKRHSGVLVEGLRYEVHLVAEGLATFIDGRYTQDQASIQRQFRETQALMHLSYDQLRQRVENLENRGQN